MLMWRWCDGEMMVTKLCDIIMMKLWRQKAVDPLKLIWWYLGYMRRYDDNTMTMIEYWNDADTLEAKDRGSPEPVSPQSMLPYPWQACNHHHHYHNTDTYLNLKKLLRMVQFSKKIPSCCSMTIACDEIIQNKLEEYVVVQYPTVLQNLQERWWPWW